MHLSDPAVHVQCWNIQRYDTPLSAAAPWSRRRRGVLRRLAASDAGIIGLQEVLDPVASEIRQRLPHYAWIGVARDDGATTGEYAPILYRRDTFGAVDAGWFWLSPSPSRPSIGWDALLPRIATWARLRPIGTTADFVVINTHFDHRGAGARARSAWLVAGEMVRWSRGCPAIVMGDLNAQPTEPPLATLQLFLQNSAVDCRGRHDGPLRTHRRGRIDHILYTKHFAPLRQRTLADPYLSDHAALQCHLTLAPPPAV